MADVPFPPLSSPFLWSLSFLFFSRCKKGPTSLPPPLRVGLRRSKKGRAENFAHSLSSFPISLRAAAKKDQCWLCTILSLKLKCTGKSYYQKIDFSCTILFLSRKSSHFNTLFPTATGMPTSVPQQIIPPFLSPPLPFALIVIPQTFAPKRERKKRSIRKFSPFSRSQRKPGRDGDGTSLSASGSYQASSILRSSSDHLRRRCCCCDATLDYARDGFMQRQNLQNVQST